MGSLFGTDGIRGVAAERPLDVDTIYRVGCCLTEALRQDGSPPSILIARDTRESGPWIESLLCAAISQAGGETIRCGVLSTPAVSFLTTEIGASAGIMISASHNPYHDNGIKIFSSEGIKLSDEVEEELEQRISNCDTRSPYGSPAELESPPLLQAIGECHTRYGAFLKGCLAPDFDLKGLRVVVDCANGALTTLAPELLRQLGATVHALHCDPDGRNINKNAGSVHMQGLQEQVLERRADLGIAFDGDADRALFVDRSGIRRDGDDILYLLARHGDLDNGSRLVVGTVMANLGLEVALREIGFQLVRTQVGDRYVLEEMTKRNASIGGEQSGHVILTRLARTGDGMLTALKVLETLDGSGGSLEELCAPVTRFPQVLLNVKVAEKISFDSIPGLQEAEAQCKASLGADSRIVLRYSGTESLARVMVEGRESGPVHTAARQLASIFENLVPSRK